ncbi:MAG: hypothetical protein ACI857_002763, partial [Arenicella sp.]
MNKIFECHPSKEALSFRFCDSLFYSISRAPFTGVIEEYPVILEYTSF